MYDVVLKDIKSGRVFTVKKSTPYLLNQFLSKVRFSKRVKLLDYKSCY